MEPTTGTSHQEPYVVLAKGVMEMKLTARTNHKETETLLEPTTGTSHQETYVVLAKGVMEMKLTARTNHKETETLLGLMDTAGTRHHET